MSPAREAVLAHETVCVLMTPDTAIPLTWVRWQGSRVVCRLLTPDNTALQQMLVSVQLACKAYPCMLKDPVAQQWLHFEAYLAEVKVTPVFEVTLVPAGAIQVSDASRYTPRPPRQQRRDAGQPRTRKAVPIAT